MSDLTTMLRDQARAGFQAQLDAAVTNGNTEDARKAAAELEKLAMATAPKAPPFTDVEIRAELDKQPWFGTDPKKSAKVAEFGKTLDPKKFNSAADFAAAIVKAIDAEFAPPVKDPPEEDPENEDGEEDPPKDKDKDAPTRRRTDGPTDGDANGVRTRRTSGPWTKLADAPAAVQADANRAADKFAPRTKEGRTEYIGRFLEAAYGQHQRAAGKK